MERSVCLEQLFCILEKAVEASVLVRVVCNVDCYPHWLHWERVLFFPQVLIACCKRSWGVNIDGWNVSPSHLHKTTISASSLPPYTISDFTSCQWFGGEKGLDIVKVVDKVDTDKGGERGLILIKVDIEMVVIVLATDFQPCFVGSWFNCKAQLTYLGWNVRSVVSRWKFKIPYVILFPGNW